MLGKTSNVTPQGTMSSLRPLDDIIPQGYIGRVAQHTGQQLYNAL